MPRRIAGQRRPKRDHEGTAESFEVTQATPEASEQASELPGDTPTITQSDEQPVSKRVEPAADQASEQAEPEAKSDDLPAGSRSRVSVVLASALGILLVLIMALAGVLGVKAWKGKEAEDARGQAAAAGRKAAETALSYDYRTLDKSFADARATMTPDFAGKFDATAKVAGELATKTKATVRAEVREVGVRDGDADRVTLIIFVNQTTTSTITQGKPRIDLNRTRFTMVRNGDQWLVQEIAGL
ncbi:hypothetical protein [Kribbella catacumbae]|uniref:hypothetical protein n=1 Tax=Kribbella catacumbae TaxID=460086 RepID=UPI000360BDE5|nr:hypothetical protein [Kribbella catacumbae]